MAELPKGVVKIRRGDGFLHTEDRLDVAATAVGAITDFMQQELKIVKILCARLEQHVSKVGFDDALDRSRMGVLSPKPCAPAPEFVSTCTQGSLPVLPAC